MNKPRRVTPNDLNGINQIREALNYPPLFESDIKSSGKCESFVSEDNIKIIAYLSLRSDMSFQSDDDGTLDIFVLPDSQRHGTGRALIKHAFQFASCDTVLKRLIAGVSDDNPDASGVKQFLKKVGFVSKYRYGKAERFEKDIER